MEYHVAKTGNDGALGTKDAPFLTISRAAQVAVAGDVVVVHTGVYREWVNPVNGGTAGNAVTISGEPGQDISLKAAAVAPGTRMTGSYAAFQYK